MSSSHRVARAVVLALLLFAATDLTFPAGCGDAPSAPDAALMLSGGDDASIPGHQCDDCFCCSRTVRASAIVSVPASVREMPAPIVALPEPRSLVVRSQYHPPIA